MLIINHGITIITINNIDHLEIHNMDHLTIITINIHYHHTLHTDHGEMILIQVDALDSKMLEDW